MANSPQNLSQFWQELKRRNVVRVVTIYAGAAFVILELVDIIAEPLKLPEWFLTAVIIILCVGFIITAFASWIYDIHPEGGMVKTEPVDVAAEAEAETKPVRRKLRVSDVIIGLLFAVVLILVYPKIFRKDKFASLRDEEGRISIAVMPFENMTNDTLWDVWEGGLQNELITHLSNSRELSLRQYGTISDILQSLDNINYTSISPSIAGDLSRKLQVSTFILGSIKSTGDRFRLSAHLIDATTEETYKTFQLDGNEEEDVFRITDSLSNLIQNYLEIKVIEKEADPVISIFGTETNSVEAFRYYINGYNLFSRGQWANSIELFNRALEIDSSFFLPRVFRIVTLYNQLMLDEGKIHLQELNEQKEYVPYKYQLLIEHLNSIYAKDPQRDIKYVELILEIDPYQRNFWLQKGGDHYQIHQYQQAIECYEKALEIDRQWGMNWEWIAMYAIPGEIYHELNNHEREKELYELGLTVLPDHPRLIYKQAVCALSQGDTIAANKLIKKYKSIIEQQGRSVQSLVEVGWIYEEADYLEEAEKIYRQAYNINNHDVALMYDLAYFLIENEINVSEGMEFISSALENEPENWNFLYIKGSGLYKQGKIEEAHEILLKAWDLRPRYYHEHYLLLQDIEQALASQNL